MSQTPGTKIVGFDPTYLAAYVALNREWIQTHFKIEEMDLKQLEDPYTHILNPGGEIFFAVVDGEAVGTVAMVPHGPNCYELAKMAVSPHLRGKGYGILLMETAIAWAARQNANSILLLSNTVLAPAIALYHRHGFETTQLGPHPDYERCNIVMELRLPARGI